MTRGLSLASEGRTLALGRDSGVSVLLRSQGFGMPPVQNQWAEGAGNGRRHRGRRLLGRDLKLGVKIEGETREQVRQRFSLLAAILDPEEGLARLTVNIDGSRWYLDGIRTGGGDFDWGDDTDTETLLLTSVTFGTEEAYWTAVDGQAFPWAPSDTTDGLLTGTGSMVAMSLSGSDAAGTATVTNIGDAPVPVVATAYGPFNGFRLISPRGELVEWTGTKLAGQFVRIDMGAGTAVDDTGANVYGALNDVPQFWSLPAGSSAVTIQVDDPTSATSVVLLSQPRRRVMF